MDFQPASGDTEYINKEIFKNEFAFDNLCHCVCDVLMKIFEIGYIAEGKLSMFYHQNSNKFVWYYTNSTEKSCIYVETQFTNHKMIITHNAGFVKREYINGGLYIYAL